MLNRFITITLLVALFSSNFSRFFIYAGFKANQKFIAATLCENKLRPWLHCDGNCYLMKKIKAAAEKEKSDERETRKSLFQEAFFATTDSFKFHNYLLDVINTLYLQAEPIVVYTTIFHPPKLV